jgi:hypothetical protein
MKCASGDLHDKERGFRECVWTTNAHEYFNEFSNKTALEFSQISGLAGHTMQRIDGVRTQIPGCLPGADLVRLAQIERTTAWRRLVYCLGLGSLVISHRAGIYGV